MKLFDENGGLIDSSELVESDQVVGREFGRLPLGLVSVEARCNERLLSNFVIEIQQGRQATVELPTQRR